MKTLNIAPWLLATTLSLSLATPAFANEATAQSAKAPNAAPAATQSAPAAPLAVEQKPAQQAAPAAPLAVEQKPAQQAAKPEAKPQPQAKPEAKKPAAKPQAKPEVKAEAKKPAAKPEVKAEAKKPAAKPEVKAEAKKPAAKPEAKAEAKKPAAKPEAKPEVKVQPKAPVAQKRPAPPKIWNTCVRRVNGPYKFGQASHGCDVAAYEDDREVQNTLGDLIFNQKSADHAKETVRYTTNLFRFVRDTSAAYYLKRNPRAGKEEVAAFQRGFMALLHQESFWTHYRISNVDSRLKIMKGDEDQSFGIAQIHSGWHKNMLVKYRGWNISGNVVYGMDMYYRGWNQAKNLRCVRTFEGRARAAYVIFNAGSGGCRFVNPHDKWAQNDRGYYEKWKNQMWQKYLGDKTVVAAASPIDAQCLIEYGSDCVKK